MQQTNKQTKKQKCRCVKILAAEHRFKMLDGELKKSQKKRKVQPDGDVDENKKRRPKKDDDKEKPAKTVPAAKNRPDKK